MNPNFTFDTVAGRYVVLSFLGSTRVPAAERLLREVVAHAQRFDVTNAIFFGVTADRADVERAAHEHPGRIYFYDVDLKVSRLYGVVGGASDGANLPYTCRTFVLDPSLRIVAIIGLGDDAAAHLGQVLKVLDSLPPPATRVAMAPVLVVPYVFEPALCQELIDYYEARGGHDSGFMRDVDGKTVGIVDHAHKRRMDCEVSDERLLRTTQERIRRRLVPAIRQAYQFGVTRIERHIVACYDAAQGAHFRAHRDNTTLGTAHRRFAVTINLNAPEYEGGEIWFPEFGPTRHKAPSGSAIVFSCSLLHEVPRVTRGKRYAFLPFLYDDAAAAVRDRNRAHVADAAATGTGKPDACDAAPRAAVSTTAVPILDGSCGCGNPNGCGTCLSAPSYEIGRAEPVPDR